jgi:hypothetical protein
MYAQREAKENGMYDDRLPDLLTVSEVMALTRLNYRPCLRFLKREIEPLGGVVKTAGQRGNILVHRWAILKFLKVDPTKCPGCSPTEPTTNRNTGEGVRDD